jgi:hypothetical protein
VPLGCPWSSTVVRPQRMSKRMSDHSQGVCDKPAGHYRQRLGQVCRRLVIRASHECLDGSGHKFGGSLGVSEGRERASQGSLELAKDATWRGKRILAQAA